MPEGETTPINPVGPSTTRTIDSGRTVLFPAGPWEGPPLGVERRKMPERETSANNPDGPNPRAHHKAALEAARAEVARIEHLIERVRAAGGFNPRFGSVSYIKTSSLDPAKVRLEWHKRLLRRIRREKRRAQLRTGRQAYERRHPERASRFITLRNKSTEKKEK